MNKGFSVLKVLFCKEEVFSILHELINIESGLPKDISVIGCASEDKLSELILKNSANKKNVIFCDNQQISIVKLNELEKNMADYQNEMPVFDLSLRGREETEIIFGSVVKNYFVPKKLGLENTKPKKRFKKRRDLFF